ncbi:hypothetical protein [Leptolyngbya sp. NIES-2104]|uniref:hypothetical protein n=1 Tax=Leptolyngbya sp. NIES-2104 TaxID=1552121 RepID=UPI0006ECA65B|nr:hypothetical protein [Leptolyngbya sp. NIES-2104]GAQ00175.1 hypothetical protein NIES2104_67400 [Leptolyngbya sp. NIES-2104]
MKRELKDTFIKIPCTATQKKRIQDYAAAANAKSVAQYGLTLLLAGETNEFGSLRRKAEGALLNGDTYRLLREIRDLLQANPNADDELIQRAIEVVNQVGRDIALHRLAREEERLP